MLGEGNDSSQYSGFCQQATYSSGKLPFVVLTKDIIVIDIVGYIAPFDQSEVRSHATLNRIYVAKSKLVLLYTVLAKVRQDHYQVVGLVRLKPLLIGSQGRTTVTALSTLLNIFGLLGALVNASICLHTRI